MCCVRFPTVCCAQLLFAWRTLPLCETNTCVLAQAAWCLSYFSAMLYAGVPNTEIHLYAKGRHGNKLNTINQNRFVRVNFSSCLRAFRFGESTCHVVAAAVHSIEMAHYACLQGNCREAPRAREGMWYAS